MIVCTCVWCLYLSVPLHGSVCVILLSVLLLLLYALNMQFLCKIFVVYGGQDLFSLELLFVISYGENRVALPALEPNCFL